MAKKKAKKDKKPKKAKKAPDVRPATRRVKKR
jgi:hypothetical protein